MFKQFVRPALLLAATAALGACSAYDSYGYGGTVVSVGYGNGGYYPYSSRYDRYDPYGYYGWYDGFYYPGTGYYIYDRGGTRHRWSDQHRRYWEGRRGGRDVRENWSAWRGQQYSGRQGENRTERWQGRDQRGQQGWQGNRQRQDRQQWQGRSRDGDSVAGQRVERQPRVMRQQQQVERQQQQRAERPQRSVNRGEEFRRGRERRGD
ncbi:peptidase [Tsuneonella sp. HG222]